VVWVCVGVGMSGGTRAGGWLGRDGGSWQLAAGGWRLAAGLVVWSGEGSEVLGFSKRV
jgi:hypothetical protein